MVRVVKRFSDLRDVHIKRVHSKPRPKTWVSNWRKLANKSRHETLTEVQAFLREKGLLDGDVRPTRLAWDIRLVRVDATGRTLWSLRKYGQIRDADRKVRQVVAGGGQPHASDLRRALLTDVRPHWLVECLRAQGKAD